MKRFKSNIINLTPIVLALIIEIYLNKLMYGNFLGKREYSVIVDPVAHILLVIGVLFPWVKKYEISYKTFLLSLFFILLIDLDHFVASGTLSMTDALSLPYGRPATHSVLSAAVIGSIVGLIFKNLKLGLLVFGGISVHLIRDMASGAPWAWPFKVQSITSLSYELRVFLHLLLAALGSFLPKFKRG